MSRQLFPTQPQRQFAPISAVAVLAAAIVAACHPGGACRAADSGGGSAPVALLAGRVLLPDGTLQPDTAVVVQAGRIKRLVPAADVKGPELRRFGEDTVLCPGLIDLFSTLGAVGQNVETARFVDPDARAADAVDPWNEDFSAALRSGVTTAMVAPAAGNLVCGTCVTFRTFVTDGRIDLLRDDGPLLFALAEGVWQPERAPTSRAGTLYELRGLLAQAREGEAHPRINAAVAGRQDALVVCGSGQDAAAARDALGGLVRRLAVVHSEAAIDLADHAKDLRRPVVVGPYGFSTGRRELLGAAALAEGGLEVAFRGGFPQTPPAGLRTTAALAVRHGMDPAAARCAITIVPAKVAGVAGRIGAVSPGKDADLVVFSQDPLRPDARVLEVYVRGVRVYRAAHHETAHQKPAHQQTAHRQTMPKGGRP